MTSLAFTLTLHITLPGLWRHLDAWPLYVLAFSLSLLKLPENTAYPCCLHFMFIHPQSSAVCLVTASLLKVPSQRSHKTSSLQSFFSLHLIADLSWSSTSTLPFFRAQLPLLMENSSWIPTLDPLCSPALSCLSGGTSIHPHPQGRLFRVV